MWVRNLLFLLLLSSFFGLPQPAAPAPRQRTAQPPLKHANELTLAGLRPGRDILAAALHRYSPTLLASVGPTNAEPSPDAAGDSVKLWRDSCRHESLQVESDDQSLIQEITVSSIDVGDAKCDPRQSAALNAKAWVTGRGLRLGDSRQRVIQLYGPPNSSGPSVRGRTQLDFLYYAFDWAGADVPQVLEIYCARDSGRVLEITLAYPSL